MRFWSTYDGINNYRGRWLVLLLVFMQASLFAENYSYTYEWNDNINSAYRSMMQLRLNNAKAQLMNETTNGLGVYLLDKVEFTQAFIGESNSQFEAYLTHADERIELLTEADENSPYHLFIQSEIYLHRAEILGMNGEYIKAMWDIRKAYNLIQENVELFPDFKANYKTLGFIQVTLGTVPDNWKWGASLLGINADAGQGFARLRELLYYASNNSEFSFRDETVINYALLQMNVANKPQEALAVLKKAGFPKSGECMQYYVMMYVCAFGSNAKSGLSYAASYPQSSEITAFPRIRYLKALMELQSLRLDDAKSDFTAFAATYQGSNNLKDVYQKLGWIAVLKGDMKAYEENRQKVISMGQSKIDVDKQALNEAQKNIPPHPVLLKARLLSDGGDFTAALTELQSLSVESFKGTELHKEEYLYRKGRVLQQMKSNAEAIPVYKSLLAVSSSTGAHYKPNAALQLGYEYQSLAQADSAKKFFRIAIDFKNHDYESSIEQKAKAALALTTAK